MSELSTWASAAVTHVEGSARGGPLDADLRVTLNFHPDRERPKYGALNHRRRPVGGAPRFGSAHLRLASATVARTTCCYPDSVFEPDLMATSHRFDLIAPAEADRATGTVDDLDGHVEAHVHGVVDLAADVEALVLDPAVIGHAAATELHDRQTLKQVWHLVARFGAPTTRGAQRSL